MGIVLNKLQTGSSLLFDKHSEIIVQLLHGALKNITELELLNGANKALIGEELIQFQNVEDLGNNKYKLSKLLRGRQGTEWAIDHHKIGEKFILLSQEIALHQIPNNLIGRTISYKPVSIGKTLAETASTQFTYTAKQLRPFAPVHAKSTKDESGNIIITLV